MPCASRRLTRAHAPAGSKLAAGPQQEPPAGLLSRFGPAEQGPSRHPRRCALVATFITDSLAMLSGDLWGGGWLTLCTHSCAKGGCAGDEARKQGLLMKSPTSPSQPAGIVSTSAACGRKRGMLAGQVQGRMERSLEREVVLIEMFNQAAPRGSHKQPQDVIIALPRQTRSSQCRGL